MSGVWCTVGSTKGWSEVIDPSKPTWSFSTARRWVFRGAVYLTLGVVSCVLVTWWMSLVRPWSELMPNVFGRTTYLGMRSFWGAGALHEYSEMSVDIATTPVRDVVYVGVGVLRHETVEAMREGATPQSDEDFEQKFRGKLQRAAAESSILARALPDVPIVRTPDGRLRVVQATYWGWPMRCLSAVWIVRVADSTGFNRKTVLGGWLAFENSFGYPRFILPYSPVWPGLIVNTLLYTAAIGRSLSR